MSPENHRRYGYFGEEAFPQIAADDALTVGKAVRYNRLSHNCR
jgi:hypothetical protein